MDIQNKQRIGKLTVLDSDYSTDDYQRRLCLVECECGTRKAVLLANLKQGRTQSCGLCTARGGVRKRPYKPRRGFQEKATPRRRADALTTVKVTGIGKGAGTNVG